MGYSKEYLEMIGNTSIVPAFSFEDLFNHMDPNQYKSQYCEGFGSLGYSKLRDGTKLLMFYVYGINLKHTFVYTHPIEEIISNPTLPLFGDHLDLRTQPRFF